MPKDLNVSIPTFGSNLDNYQSQLSVIYVFSIKQNCL